MRVHTLEKLYEKMLINETYEVELKSITDNKYNLTFEVGKDDYILPTGAKFRIDRIINMPPTIFGTIMDGDYAGREVNFPVDRFAKMQHEYIVALGGPQPFILRSSSYGESDSFFYILGFTINDGYISLQTPEQYADNIIEQYENATGEDPTRNPAFNITSKDSKWSPQLRIKLPSIGESKMKNLNIKFIETKSGIEINDTKFVWTLIEKYGLKLGRNKKRADLIEGIISKLSQSQEDAFLSGMRASERE